MPLYRKLGDGDADAIAGFEATHQMSYKELSDMLHEDDQAHPVSCVDCHDPDTIKLRVTRPGFIQGIQALAESDAPLPQIPSIERWKKNRS
jgi:nitrite reductase (cytochrome c-552)